MSIAEAIQPIENLTRPIRILSFGAGRQSTRLLIGGVAGMFEDMPDAAIFADTGGEPRFVYEWLDFITEFVKPFPIYRASIGNLGQDYVSGIRRAAIPAFTTSREGKPTMMSRFCSKTYKVELLARFSRKILDASKGVGVESWIGISTDEAHRAYKPTGVKWRKNRYPLLEKDLSALACEEFVREVTGRTPPKSACVFCPYHNDSYWIDLKRNHPLDFGDACNFDDSIRDMDNDKWDQARFLHRSLRPLRQIEFLHENQGALTLDEFGNECEGACGL